MKIKQVKTIKNYKSFQDFSWHNFFNTENFHQKTNILYGENGSGKSSICNILKSVSQNKKFTKCYPEETQVLIDSKRYKYTRTEDKWDDYIPKDSILFFDREFVDRNVHLGRERGTQQGEQEQESGNLVIEFDGDAINLRAVRDKLAGIKEDKNQKLDDFKKSNRRVLDFELDEDEEKLFRKYNRKDENTTKNIREKLGQKRMDLSNKLKLDRQLLQKTREVQAIQELEDIDIELNLSSKTSYQKVFNFKLKERAKVEAERSLVDQIKKHKEFFEMGFDVRDKHPNQCPFCGTKNREEEIKQIIKTYNQIYDESYKEQEGQFERHKETLIEELKQIQETLNEFELDDYFIRTKKLVEQYAIKGLYEVEKEEYFRKLPPLKKIDELKTKLVNLGKPTKEDISILFGEARIEFSNLKKYFSELARFVKAKNKLIGNFKKEHTDEKLAGRIEKNQSSLNDIEWELGFINSNKIESNKLKLQQLKELNKLIRSFERAREAHKIARESYEEYCAKGAFQKTLRKIESYFSNFKFSFTLQLDTDNRHTGSTKELPLAFKVIDPDGTERDLKEGLSEGEIQVLSLCFFFAFLDIQKDKDKKVLVFDDPITSLDDSNLSSLVDLIATEKDKFSQTFVFTHHRTFFKFLRKKFRNQSLEYNILRNKNRFGGSFICKSMMQRFIEKLNNFEAHLLQLGQNQNGFDVELQIVEYGQYLRYETENFIKCRLLHLDVLQDFPKVVDGIKANKQVSDDDLDKIKSIYSFCNWTTSHVDVGDDHGLSQLKGKITDFNAIYQKY